MLPQPEHDVWIRVCDLIDERSVLKACSQVCAARHSRLQPQVLLSIAIMMGSTLEHDRQALMMLSPLV
jgi:hypothetical protein